MKLLEDIVGVIITLVGMFWIITGFGLSILAHLIDNSCYKSAVGWGIISIFYLILSIKMIKDNETNNT